MSEDLARSIEALWENRDDMASVMSPEDARRVIHAAVELLDSGQGRCAEVIDGKVVVHQWLKQAVLLLFRVQAMETIELGPFEFADKIPLKKNYMESRVRVVPGASARWGSYLAPGVTSLRAFRSHRRPQRRPPAHGRALWRPAQRHLRGRRSARQRRSSGPSQARGHLLPACTERSDGDGTDRSLSTTSFGVRPL